MNWNINPTETENYLKACKDFCEDENLFLNFKKNKDFQVILEHLSPQEGGYYFDRITEDLKSDQSIIDKFKENDLFGNPSKHLYESYGHISPSTIRYISNLSDIKKYFSGIKFDKIVEIGGGYGGLAKTLNCYYDYKQYILADLPEVNQLSKKYLNLFPKLKNKIFHRDCFNFEKELNIDLVISNYALSELSFDSQKEYYDKIIVNAEHFYIMYNHLAGTYDEFYNLANNDFVIETEEELRGNVIMYGKKR